MAHHSCGQSQGGPWLPYWGHEGLKLQCAWACHGLMRAESSPFSVRGRHFRKTLPLFRTRGRRSAAR